MSRPIARLFVLVLVLFAALIAFTSRWTVFDASALCHQALNHRSLIRELRVPRGSITAADGTVLARSVRAQGKTYRRVYPQGELFGHPVGYSDVAQGQQAGLEQSRNDALAGPAASCGSESIMNEVSGATPRGDNVASTLDPKAQRVALAALGGRAGSVVAIDPRTGAVKVMVSVPGFDPNHVGPARSAPGSPLLDRATQGRYPPGSTFKLVTTAAALDSGKYTPNSIINGASPKTIGGVPLSNDAGESFGDITLTKALTFSVNTVFGQVGESLGKRTMGEYMKRFGFYSDAPLDYPPDQIVPSGEYRSNGKLLPVTSDRVDVGRLAIGQDKLEVSPLQMAMVVAAIANDGVLLKPHLTSRIVDPDGRTADRIAPETYHRVMSPRTAHELTAMMRRVVEEGTGTAVQLPGIDVAGKTGTAQVGATGSNLTQPWFVAFAPAGKPRIAIAVTVERSNGGFGGTVAAPIARSVLEALLHG